MARKEAQAETLLCIYVFMPKQKIKKKKEMLSFKKGEKKVNQQPLTILMNFKIKREKLISICWPVFIINNEH